MGALAEDPPFQRIAVVGLGLIGGSIALAVRTRWPSVRILGVDRVDVLKVALARGAIDEGQTTLGGSQGAHLIVLAAPVAQNISMVRTLAREIAGSAVITDVGSTKRRILDAAAELPERLTFVGGHPLGGSAKNGFAYARGSLFHDRPWILTPAAGAREDVLTRLSAFARGVGAWPRQMEADEHDRVMAFVSHLPQIAASALMTVTGGAVSSEGLGLAGAGLADTTRLASSSVDIWRDVCESNAEAIGTALDALTERLSDIRERLARGETVDALFEDAARWRDVLGRAQEMKGDERER